MKKISYYLIFTVILGGMLVSFWLYQKYFKEEKPELLLFKVERGSIQEIVRARGEVVPEKDYDLEFLFSGTIERVFVSEGEQVHKNNSLVKLETTDLEIDLSRLKAILAQKKSHLDKLIAGPTAEDIRVSEAKVASAKTALEDAKKNIIDKLRDAYTKSDDAVRNKADQFISSPRSANPQLNFNVTDSQLESIIESGRISLEKMLVNWKIALDTLNTTSDIDRYTAEAKNNLNETASFLNNVTLALNSLTQSSTITQTTIDTWRSDISTARTNVNTAISNLSTAEEKLSTAESNLQIAEDELVLKKSGTRMEDIAIAKAQIQEIEKQIANTEEKIRKSTLRSPAEAKVIKIWIEEGEVFTVGQPAVSLSTFEHKIQADVSELEIGKVNETDGNEVLIKLDAFPDLKFKGKIVSVDPKEIIKEGDKYYRVNVYLEKHPQPDGPQVRSGMNADLIIVISSKEDVLKIPELTIYQRENKKFVTILEENEQKEVEIKTGISDGESIEVLDGLKEGQTVAVSAD